MGFPSGHAERVAKGMGIQRGQLGLAETLPPGTAVLPEDFPERLRRIKEASGLSWNGLAEKLGVDPRQVDRWRKGVEPCGGAMLALLRLAALLPGGLDILLCPDPSSGERFYASPASLRSRQEVR